MNILGIGTIVETIGKIADNLITTDKERLEIALKEKELETELLNKVHDTNIAEAQHPSTFVAGWRPAIGWIGAISLGVMYIPKALILTGMWFYQTYMLFSGQVVTMPDLPPFPNLGTEDVVGLVLALLGIGTMRTVDKIKGVDTKKVKK